MARTTRLRGVAKGLGVMAGIAAGTYAATAAVGWWRYGAPRPARPDERDELLDRFMPSYEVVERHHVRIDAPAATTLAAAREMDMAQSWIARAIFRSREIILRAPPDRRKRPQGLLAEVLALGWGVLAEEPGREIVVGAVTKPWEADVVFRALPPDEFAAFCEPDYVKIIWNLRADPIGGSASVFRTETRVLTTDAAARRRFRRYWAFFSPGISLIRALSLTPLKREAERRARLG